MISLPAVNFQVIPASQDALARVKKRSQLNREISSKEAFYGEYFPDLISYLALAGISSGRYHHGHGNSKLSL